MTNPAATRLLASLLPPTWPSRNGMLEAAARVGAVNPAARRMTTATRLVSSPRRPTWMRATGSTGPSWALARFRLHRRSTGVRRVLLSVFHPNSTETAVSVAPDAFPEALE